MQVLGLSGGSSFISHDKGLRLRKHRGNVVGICPEKSDSQTKKNSSHRRAILWRAFWKVCGGFWEEFSEVAPKLLRSCLYMGISRQNAFRGNFLEVCFRIPRTSQKLLQKSALRCIRLLSVLDSLKCCNPDCVARIAQNRKSHLTTLAKSHVHWDIPDWSAAAPGVLKHLKKRDTLRKNAKAPPPHKRFSNQPAPKYHTKGCSRSSVHSPGARTLVFAAFESFSRCEFRASIARTPFCAILWRSPKQDDLSTRQEFGERTSCRTPRCSHVLLPNLDPFSDGILPNPLNRRT